MYTRFSYIQGTETFISYSTIVYATVKITIVGLQAATLIVQKTEYILAAAEYNLITTIFYKYQVSEFIRIVILWLRNCF